MEDLPTLALTLKAARIDDLLRQDPQRPIRFSCEAAGLACDYSRHFLTEPVLSLLTKHADVMQLEAHRDALFSGQILNHSEQRAVGHTALRALASSFYHVNGEDVMQKVIAAKAKCAAFVSSVRAQQWPIAVRDVVHIGVGGSFAGPRLMMSAWAHLQDGGHRTHWVASADQAAMHALLAKLDARYTLFVWASKSFTTTEVVAHAKMAKAWLQARVEDWTAHVVAVTAEIKSAQAWGVPEAHILPLWDWVGGRYSLCSSVAVTAMLAVGVAPFEAMLAGARAMDAHFRAAPWRHNMPVIMAFISYWYQRYFDAHSHCLVAYDDRLAWLVPYVQQLVMESNGKLVDRHGQMVDGHTAPIVWGGLGTSAQHSYFQLLHQGTRFVPVDLLLVMRGADGSLATQADMMAHGLAQGAALMAGTADAHGHQHCPGNRPSTTLMMEALTPETLGALVALYEHKTFVEGVMLGINSFDQWGVSLAKGMYPAMRQSLQNAATDKRWDASTQHCLARYRAVQVRDEAATAEVLE